MLLLTVVTACGSGGEGGSSIPTGVAVTGNVTGPGGAVAQIAPLSKSWFASLFEVAEAFAQQVTGWSAVPNATVRVFRIDDTGNPVGTTVIPPVTTAPDGSFSLILPTGTVLDSTLVVQVENDPSINGPVAVGIANTYSTLLVQTTVALNPAVEAATQAIVNNSALLSDFTNAEVTQIVNGISNLVAQNPPAPPVTTNTISTTFGAAITQAVTAASGATAGAPVLLTTTLPTGVDGTAYSAALSAVGGAGTLTWSLQSGTLPAGLALNVSTGVISGTPTTQGLVNFTVLVQDSATPTPQSASRALSLSIVAAPLAITTTSPLPAGTVGQPYNQTLAATGGTPGFIWSLDAVSPLLPVGLSVNPAGAITGTPTAAGTVTITVKVQDAGSPQQTTTKQLSLTINPPGPPPVSITTLSPLPSGTVGQAYNTTLAVTGGTPPFTWSLAPGSNPLPAGLTLNGASGQINGTPTVQGASTPTIRVQDSGNPQQSATKQLSLTINAVPSFNYGGTLTLTNQPANVDNIFTVGAPFGSIFSGDAFISWDEQAGTIQEFVALSYNATSGQLVSLAYSVFDSANQGTSPSFTSFTCVPPSCAGVTLNTNTGILTLTNTVVSTTFPAPGSVTLNGTLTFSPVIGTTPIIPTGIVGQLFNFQLPAIGGTLPYTWSLAPGSQPLPGGLNLGSNGVISGTPTTDGLFGDEDTTGSIFFRVMDAQGHFSDLNLNMNIYPTGTTSVLNSRVVEGMSFTFGPNVGNVSGATAFYDSQSRLTGVEVPPNGFNLFGQQTTRNTLTVYESFAVSAGTPIVRMSRWGGPGTGGGLPNLTANQGYHHVSGVATAFASLPATGQTVYNVIASTNPTIADGTVAPGSGVTGTVTVNWAGVQIGTEPPTKKVLYNLTVNTPSGPVTYQSTGSITDPNNFSLGTIFQDGTIGGPIAAGDAAGSFFGTETIPQYMGLTIRLPGFPQGQKDVMAALVLQKQ